MTDFYNDIILDTDVNYSILSIAENFKRDDIRNIDLYTFMTAVDNFLETRHDKTDRISIDVLDKSGEKNSVVYSNGSTLTWQKIGKIVEGVDRITITSDEAFVYEGATMVPGNFNWIEGVEIISTRIIPDNEGGVVTTKINLQQADENEWIKLYPKTTGEHHNFTEASWFNAGDTYEQNTGGNTATASTNIVKFWSKQDNLGDVVGKTVVDKINHTAILGNRVSIWEDVKESQVIASMSSSKYSNSAITSDGTVTNWGQISDSDYVPPSDVPFNQVVGSQYFHVGLTEEGFIKVWGYYGSLYTRRVYDYTPIEEGHQFVAAGYDCGLAINIDNDLVHWGSTIKVGPSLFPPRYTTKTEGNIDRTDDDFVKIDVGYYCAGALRRDGRLEMFGSDANSQISTVPDYDDFVDFSVGYKGCLGIRANGDVVWWGNDTTYMSYGRPDFADKTIIKVKAGKYNYSAISSTGECFMWGSPTNTTVFGVSKSDVSAIDFYEYSGVYSRSDFTFESFTKISTSEPWASINNNHPNQEVTLKSSGTYTAGFEHVYEVDNNLDINNFYIVNSKLGYHGYSSDLRDRKYFTFFEVENVQVMGDDVVEVNYKSLDINTKKLTFIYDVCNSHEICRKIEIGADTTVLGE
jgi:hypothetical protein